MKIALQICIFSTLVIGVVNSQSVTFEIVPDFSQKKNAITSQVYEYNYEPETLDFLGLSCFHHDRDAVAIFYRLRTADMWSDWIEFDRQHEFVESNRRAYQTKSIQKSFSHIQFKTAERIRSPLTIRFFLPSQDKIEVANLKSFVACDLPDICERECWCPTCPIDDTPQITEPTHLIVHHSAGNNESNNFANVVEFIWDLHVNTNGWDDIGYNWLIDPNGIIYQGRPDNYQGAHFSCINENTIGVCVIGDYTSVQPSEAALSSLVSLLAYEATEHAIDISTDSYHVTGDFLLDNIAGHRDSSGSMNACSGTVCPGDSFYPLLPDIRQQISELTCYNEVTSTHDKSIIDNFYVFPNPIDDRLYIQSDKYQKGNLEIVDVRGKAIGIVQVNESNDLSHLMRGVYFLLFDGMMVEKLIKQ